MSKRTLSLTGLFCLIMIGLFLLSNPTTFAASTPDPEAKSAVHAAWLRAEESGAYSYQTTILQTSTPRLVLENVGRSPVTQRLYIEGALDKTDEAMRMKLWSNGGSTVFGGEGVEIKVEEGKAFGRTAGQDWEEINDFTGLFAPGNDPLGFLRAATEITQGDAVPLPDMLRTPGPDAVNTYTPYTFALDGTVLAEFIRAQTEAKLRADGELPVGMEIGPAQQFLDMTGQGEVWIDDDTGLPLRQIITLSFPPDEYEEQKATITTDFMTWQPAPMDTWAARTAQLTAGVVSPAQIERIASTVAAIVLTLLFLGILVYYRRDKRLYAGFAIAMILNMVVLPALHTQQVYAANVANQERVAKSEKEQETQRNRQELETEQAVNDFDPHKDPLANLDPALVTAPAGPAAEPAPDPYQELYDSLPLTDDGTDTDGDTIADTDTHG